MKKSVWVIIIVILLVLVAGFLLMGSGKKTVNTNTSVNNGSDDLSSVNSPAMQDIKASAQDAVAASSASGGVRDVAFDDDLNQ